MMVAMALGLGLTILLGKPFIRRLQALKIGHTIRIADVSALAGTYDKSKAIPSMGGIALYQHSLSYLLLDGLAFPLYKDFIYYDGVDGDDRLFGRLS